MKLWFTFLQVLVYTLSYTDRELMMTTMVRRMMRMVIMIMMIGAFEASRVVRWN